MTRPWATKTWVRVFAIVGAASWVHGPAAQAETVEYYGHDALGSVRVVFDTSGTAIARADYEPFGEAYTVPSMPGPSGLPAKQFTGQERDAEASLDYFGARFFVPRTGRFPQVDPVYAGLFDPQQWNRYAYARNNPLMFIDPTGMQASTGIPGYCSAFNSYERCGGDDLFWGSGGGGGFSFGDSYAGALDRGFVPGMAADVWAGLEQFKADLQHQINALEAQGLARAGDFFGALDVMHRDGTLVMFFSPDLASSADMSYRDLVDTALKAHGVWDLLDHDQTEWTGSGYILHFQNGVNIASVLGSNYNFANGGLGILHARDVGWPNQDFRSFTSSRAPYSLQVTTGRLGTWADVDLSNPYQSVGSFLGHTLEVLKMRRIR
ncbi:MAG: hypothetical protein JNM38_12650 [Acidobacteria bacterium]|nr:hypothetical protein [Acidobacteriota bacterium]